MKSTLSTLTLVSSFFFFFFLSVDRTFVLLLLGTFIGFIKNYIEEVVFKHTLTYSYKNYVYSSMGNIF